MDSHVAALIFLISVRTNSRSVMRILPALAVLSACAHVPDPGLRIDPSPPAGVTVDVFEARDGTQLAAMHWLSTSAEPRAVVVLVHGLKDHASNYVGIAGRLVAAGYEVHALDLRGHGRSAGPRAAPGRWNEYADDLELFLQAVERRSPGRAVFLFGHSMGGAVATLVALDHEPKLAGLILSAPALAVDAPPLALALTQLLGMVVPRARVLDLANRDFSSDPAVSRAMDRDPWISQGPAPARTAFGLVSGIRQIWERIGELQLPMLALHGTRDSLTAPAGSRALIFLAPSTDKTLRIYEGLQHNLLHEPRREQVETDIIAWLDAHTGGPAVAAPPIFAGTLRGEPVGWTQAIELGAGIAQGIGFAGTTSLQLARPRPLGWHGGLTAQRVGSYKAVALRPLGFALRAGGAVIGASAGAGFITGGHFALSYAAWGELPLGPLHIGLLAERLRRIKNTHDHGPLASDQLWTSLSVRLGTDHSYWPRARAGVGPVLSGGLAWRADAPAYFVTLGVQLYGAD